MCDFSKGFKLCSCNGENIKYREQEFYRKVKGELVKIPNKKNDKIPLIYIWRLFRYIGEDEKNSMIGIYKLPTDNIGNGLDEDWIALNLNVENCFDFDYTPNEGDNIYITQNYPFAPYISFIFKNNEWIVEHYDPFSKITKYLEEGTVIEIK